MIELVLWLLSIGAAITLLRVFVHQFNEALREMEKHNESETETSEEE